MKIYISRKVGSKISKVCGWGNPYPIGGDFWKGKKIVHITEREWGNEIPAYRLEDLLTEDFQQILFESLTEYEYEGDMGLELYSAYCDGGMKEVEEQLCEFLKGNLDVPKCQQTLKP